ncbi:MAG: MFS transporter [Actinomycetia bacterium]|nr:MFS transporter [Actinomycetes bacterium]
MSTTLPTDLDPVEVSLLGAIAGLSRSAESTPIEPLTAATLFEAQVTSRILDHTARWLRQTRTLGYYTIGSAGHEANAAVALALRPTDPALLHYRSGGFYAARATQIDGQDPVGDVLRGMLARSTDPIAGGRHKVFGNHNLGIVPQTSTIASHLPRAVGLAISLGRDDPPGTLDSPWPRDSIAVCSLGDASLNHSTAQGALNWAANTAFRGTPVPLLVLCEDNGLGISVPTPDGWVSQSTAQRPALGFATIDGSEPDQVLTETARLAAEIRATGRPAILHLRTVRFLGHAGTDVETAYRDPASMRADLDQDPILGTAQLVIDTNDCEPEDLVAWYLDERQAIRDRVDALLDEPELGSAKEIIEPLAPRRPHLHQPITSTLYPDTDAGASDGQALTLAQTINHALGAVLAARPRALVFGEDVGRKGGVYGVTRGLQSRFGDSQVFDTILDEQSILGLALGTSLDGRLPIPEIQYLAYLHNAEDQLRGEAATLSFFSTGQYRNPMVVRIAAYGYQRGFGGHFHNDNSVAVLRDIPGLIIASPSHPSDAGAMLRTCVAAAESDGSVSAFLEPIARYHTTDLFDGDGRWTAEPDNRHVPVGRGRIHGVGNDLTIVTWGNGLWLSLRARERLAADLGIEARILDLRWLAPLPVDDLLREASATGRVLVVDETRRTGGVGEGIIATLVEGGFTGLIRRVAAADSFVPLGAAANLVLVSEDDIVDAAAGITP